MGHGSVRDLSAVCLLRGVYCFELSHGDCVIVGMFGLYTATYTDI